MSRLLKILPAVLALLACAGAALAAQPPLGDAAGHTLVQATHHGSLEPRFWTAVRWSPYLVGAILGVLSWLCFLLSDNSLGASGTYVQAVHMLARPVAPNKAAANEYLAKHPAQLNWGFMLLVGLALGAFLSAVISGDFRWEMVPPLWEARFGHEPVTRWFTALCGGFILSVGARWAGGCTSGHGLSGTLQLAVSSWLAVICFFAGGIFTALLIYG